MLKFFLLLLLPFCSLTSGKPISTNKQEVISVPTGELVFKKYIYTDKNIKGYYLLQYFNKNTNKNYIYYNKPYNFAFSYQDTSPNKNFSIIQAISQGYVDEGKGKKYHEVNNSYILFHSTGCLGDTGFRFTRWTAQNMLVNEDDPLEKPIKINGTIFKNDFIDTSYPWSDKNSPQSGTTKKRKLTNFLANRMGVDNELACTPITKDNVKYYTYLHNELKTYRFNLEASKINGAISKFNKHVK